jgi:hypothetical protein
MVKIAEAEALSWLESSYTLNHAQVLGPVTMAISEQTFG